MFAPLQLGSAKSSCAAPRSARRPHATWGVRPVAVEVFGGAAGGVGGAEVGAVAAEYLDPLTPGVLDGLGDEVGDVALAAAGHADVRRRGAGVLADQDVRGRDGRALRAVRRGRVGELDVLADVGRLAACDAPASPTTSREPGGRAADDGPHLPVGDPDLGCRSGGWRCGHRRRSVRPPR